MGAPEHVVPGGLPTELFIAWIIVSKFGDHLPFYRQAETFKRQCAGRPRCKGAKRRDG
jgi:transposase